MMERPSFWIVPKDYKDIKSVNEHIIPINTNVSPTKSVSFHPSVFQNEHSHVSILHVFKIIISINKV